MGRREAIAALALVVLIGVGIAVGVSFLGGSAEVVVDSFVVSEVEHRGRESDPSGVPSIFSVSFRIANVGNRPSQDFPQLSLDFVCGRIYCAKNITWVRSIGVIGPGEVRHYNVTSRIYDTWYHENDPITVFWQFRKSGCIEVLGDIDCVLLRGQSVAAKG